ncbi:hypothetical protein [Nitrosomonas sp. Nm34]|uniref:hypothetical protein n=1 Tax=Nitrosomonas sp. Nm34 TaxID=1881055 RepID=UPI0008F065A4|nr:hypothetical protein [Nitrosomonas sp. Nm34]SFI35148.1 hypothetical protein SAMN05428978_1006116 [Nitrosomonas sp. Nm34]
MAAPREEIGCCIADFMAYYHPATTQKIVAVGQSDKFPAGLKTLILELTALVTAHDEKIWEVDLAGITAETLVDVLLMAWVFMRLQAICPMSISVPPALIKTDRLVK